MNKKLLFLGLLFLGNVNLFGAESSFSAGREFSPSKPGIFSEERKAERAGCIAAAEASLGAFLCRSDDKTARIFGGVFLVHSVVIASMIARAKYNFYVDGYEK